MPYVGLAIGQFFGMLVQIYKMATEPKWKGLNVACSRY